MIRRLLTAVVTAAMLYGVVGARLGQAQQPARPAPSDPAEAPPPLPAETGKTSDDAPAEAPPSLGQGGDQPAPPDEPPPALPKRETESKPTPVKAPKREREPDPVPPAETAKPDPFPADPGTPGPKTDDVVPAQAPAGDGSTLPPAKEPQGGAAPADTNAPKDDPKILPPERLPLGPSMASLTVEVQAPAVANLNRPTKFTIFVKNSGTSPAIGVQVHDRLPEGLEFVKSEPSPTQRIDDILYWQLETLAAGTEKVITVTAIPRKEKEFDHAPTVSLRTGSKSRTLVKHPRLKVELTHEESGPVLKGRPVNFSVRVTNNGSGPARGVVLHANLSGGLKHEAGSSIEVVFKDYLGRETLAPGESEAIPLELDAITGGEQVCKVFADSPDVEDSPDARAEAKITVVEPKLLLGLIGSSERHANTIASYTMKVANPGTATAKKVVAAAFLPDLGGRLERTPAGATYEEGRRRLYWEAGDLAPGQEKTLAFNVRLGGVGIFKVDARAKADGCPVENALVSTHVTGMPNIKCVVIAQTGVLDVGEETTYEIQLKNSGTKEATDLQVKAIVSEHLLVVATDGTKDQARSSSKDEPHDSNFPPITLPPGASQTLVLHVKAIKPGLAKCTVTEKHGDLVTEYSTQTKVTDPK